VPRDHPLSNVKPLDDILLDPEHGVQVPVDHLRDLYGYTFRDIAEQLRLTPKPVSVTRARVLEKLGLTNNSDLFAYAIRNGLV